MRPLLLALGAALFFAGTADAGENAKADEEAFHAAAELFRNSRGDRTAAIDAFQRLVEKYPHSRRAADAYFSLGEALFDRALQILDADPGFSRDRLGARLPDAALRSLQEAEQAYLQAERRAVDDGLRSTAAYRQGEAAYNERQWDRAAKQFQKVAAQWPKSYVARPSLLGLAYASLAQEDFARTAEVVQKLGQDAPTSFLRGILALHAGDYAEAERLLSAIDTPQAKYYLGKTYLAWQKPLLAATLLNKLSQESPIADLREAAGFFLGDAFFLSKDYTGAIDKYENFLKTYPFSRFKMAALYRIGSSNFEKGDYGQARLAYGSLLSQFPNDYYATLARHFIGESYLVNDQMREALFAYSEVAANGRADLKPLALYRLAWTQQALGDFNRAAQTCQTFIDAYPSHALAKNVYLIQANCYAKLKKTVLAMQFFQRILDTSPGTEIAEQALFLMLKHQYDAKNYSAILTSYQYILRQLPQSMSKWRGFSYLAAAETYLRLNRVEEARPIYETVLKVYANDLASIYAQDGIAWCDELSGRHKEAVAARQKLKEMLQVQASSASLAAVNDLGIADSFYAQKDYQDAFTFYDKFAAEHPDSPASPTALYRAGFSLYHMKYYSQAVETWQKLIEKAPASPEADKASSQVADTLFRAGKPKEAAAAYEKILARTPKGEQAALATLRLAQIAYADKSDAAALAWIKSLLGDFPKSSETADALDVAEAVFDRSPAKDFRSYFGSLVAANPRSPVAGEIQFRLARRLYEAKDHAAAAKELEKLSVDYTDHPSLAKAQALLGECYLALNQPAQAVPAFERLVASFPQADDVALALFRLGGAYYGLKQYDKSAAAYERLLNDFPKSEYAKAARFNLALAYKDSGQSDHAEATYSKYIEANAAGAEEKASARWELFAIQKDRKEYAAALKTLAEIQAASAPGSEAALSSTYHAGEVQETMGDETSAQRSWELLLPAQPANSPYRLQSLVKLSQLYEKQSNWQSAASVYDDLGRNAAAVNVAQAARQRAAEIRKMKPKEP